ncbi:hypothetical protein T484DRAFT_1772205 [Baffinella frigidus]|nr:hypothetical protein T484DRAFT_1772205 [Cryptophyta sp. CCMP2293]
MSLRVPALIGNKLSCYYRQTPDLLECTCDVTSSMAAATIVSVTSSMAAATIVSVVKSACKNIVCDLVLMIEGQRDDELPERRAEGKNIVCDLVLMIEGQRDDELPERVIGACRYIKHDISRYVNVAQGH